MRTDETRQSVSRSWKDSLTLLISRACHFLVMASSCCSALSIALWTVSSTKLPMTDREMASRCSSLFDSFCTTACRSRLSLKTIRKLRLSEKYSSSLHQINFRLLEGVRSLRDIPKQEGPLIALDYLIV